MVLEEGSAGKDVCPQTLVAKADPKDLHGRKRGQVVPDLYICVVWHENTT